MKPGIATYLDCQKKWTDWENLTFTIRIGAVNPRPLYDSAVRTGQAVPITVREKQEVTATVRLERDVISKPVPKSGLIWEPMQFDDDDQVRYVPCHTRGRTAPATQYREPHET